jgi:hypothetical protein
LPRQPEAKLVAKLQAYARSRGAAVFKIHGGDNPFQAAGIPDLIINYQGRFIGAEVKMPGGKISRIQAATLKEIEAARGIAVVVTSVQDLAEAMDEAVAIEIAAWIGGFFDGEGCIYLEKGIYPRIMISQKDDEPLLWIRDTLGMGQVVYRQGRNKAGNLRSPFLSIRRREQVIRFLRLIDPHVRLRHRRLKLEEAYHALSRTSSNRNSY